MNSFMICSPRFARCSTNLLSSFLPHRLLDCFFSPCFARGTVSVLLSWPSLFCGKTKLYLFSPCFAQGIVFCSPLLALRSLGASREKCICFSRASCGVYVRFLVSWHSAPYGKPPFCLFPCASRRGLFSKMLYH